MDGATKDTFTEATSPQRRRAIGAKNWGDYFRREPVWLRFPGKEPIDGSIRLQSQDSNDFGEKAVPGVGPPFNLGELPEAGRCALEHADFEPRATACAKAHPTSFG